MIGPQGRRLSPSSDDAQEPGAAAAASSGNAGLSLAGKSVLIVEDETFVAVELKFAVEDAGGIALGPYYRLNQAMDYLSRREAAIDAAVLDVNLGGALAFPLAKRLAERGVPIVFSTANADLPQLTRDFPDSRICAKPVSPQAILAAVKDLLS